MKLESDHQYPKNMNDTDEWARFYEDDNIIIPEFALDDDEPFDAANNMAASPKISPSIINRGGLFPRSSIGKPIRRRSRASKKAPTTLLNANANNFRALVQQFTGCHSSNPTNYKGPINLNFAQYSLPEEAPHRNGRIRQDHRNILYDQGVGPSFIGIGNNNNNNNNNIDVVTTTMTTATTTTTTDGQKLFGSSVNYDQLTLDDFEMESLSLQEVSRPGDYASALPGTRNDDVFWGF